MPVPHEPSSGGLRLAALSFLAFSLVFFGFTLLQSDSEPDPRSSQGSDGAPTGSNAADASGEPVVPDAPEPVIYTIKKGDNLARILALQGVEDVEAVRQAGIEIHDLSDIRADKKFIFEPDEAGTVQRILYPLSTDETLILSRTDAGWTGEKYVRVYEAHPSRRDFTVESTLWGAAENAGLQAADIKALADVYRFDIDFNTEVQAGATAQVLVDELWEGDEFVKLGPPKIARFTNAGESYLAIRYINAAGEADYYDETGLARKRDFLRSPLGFDARVTSSFNKNRFHPIHKVSRPHNGVDFGAPTGTTVVAIGDGKVIFAGRNGGHGNYVKIDHPGPYHSSYSHLSKISVKKGDTIRQGGTVGKIGMTGTATGPHLHYQFWVNGAYVDPMKQKHARTERLSRSEMPAFNEHIQALRARLDAG